MGRNVLVAGPASLFGRCLAAHRLTSSEDQIFVATAVSAMTGSPVESRSLAWPSTAVPAVANQDRLHHLTLDPEQPASTVFADLPADIHEVWWLAGRRGGASWIRSLLSGLPSFGIKELNLVALAGETGVGQNQGAPATTSSLEAEVVEHCRASSVGYRIFRPPLLLSEALRADDGEEIMGLLGPLFELGNEISERSPDYFDFQALRWHRSAGAALHLARVEPVAERISELARESASLDQTFELEGSLEITPADFCEQLERVYEVALLPVTDPSSLNAIDRLFSDRLGDSFDLMAQWPADADADAEAQYRVTATVDEGLATPADLRSLLAAVYQRQDDALRQRRARADGLFDALEPRTAGRDGVEFPYYVTGQGEVPIVLLNALGQGLHYWCRLVEHLSHRHRVVIWEPRGATPEYRSFGLAEQVADLAAVLRAEGIERCHLVGWCTGGKVAAEYCLAEPAAVASIVFLNCAFKCLGSSKDLDTAYDHNFEPLCRALQKRPEMANSVMNSLRSSTAEDPDPAESTDSEELAQAVLAQINADLKEHVLAPFQDAASLVAYAAQMVDFWQYDLVPKADQLQVPTLFITAEYDQVASPAASRAIATHFPTAELIEIPGATHYCLYDRPEWIAELMTGFFARGRASAELGERSSANHPVPAMGS